VHFTAFCLGGPFFSGHGVIIWQRSWKKASYNTQTMCTQMQSILEASCHQ